MARPHPDPRIRDLAVIERMKYREEHMDQRYPVIEHRLVRCVECHKELAVDPTSSGVVRCAECDRMPRDWRLTEPIIAIDCENRGRIVDCD